MSRLTASSGAHAQVLGLLVALRLGGGVGREELIHRELYLPEDGAGVLLPAARALLAGHAVVVGGDEQLALPLQADDGKLAQGDVHPLALARHGQLPGEAAGDGRGDIRRVAAVPDRGIAGVHQLDAQDEGVHRVHYPHQIGKAIKVYPNHRAFSGLYAHFRPY